MVIKEAGELREPAELRDAGLCKALGAKHALPIVGSSVTAVHVQLDRLLLTHARHGSRSSSACAMRNWDAEVLLDCTYAFAMVYTWPSSTKLMSKLVSSYV